MTTLRQHVTVRFRGRLDTDSCKTVVDAALAKFLPPLYLRNHRSPESGYGPEDLLLDLDDMALDVILNGSPDPPTSAVAQDDDADRDFIHSALGDDDAIYLAALRQVGAERDASARAEYLVVTTYVTKRQVLGHPPRFAAVAEALSVYGITAADVERLMFKFKGRMSDLSTR